MFITDMNMYVRSHCRVGNRHVIHAEATVLIYILKYCLNIHSYCPKPKMNVPATKILGNTAELQPWNIPSIHKAFVDKPRELSLGEHSVVEV